MRQSAMRLRQATRSRVNPDESRLFNVSDPYIDFPMAYTYDTKGISSGCNHCYLLGFQRTTISIL